ncbi:MAG: hypothetical protein Ct9H300mP28_01430 [Pseudomonadota bacterium]|nr:MAG: hypothetical protein Ct9H300mP28_01430 [Pseudomonadota bacterium]
METIGSAANASPILAGITTSKVVAMVKRIVLRIFCQFASAVCLLNSGNPAVVMAKANTPRVSSDNLLAL